MKRVFVMMGTRPDAIKMCPVVRALAECRPHLEPVVCVTAQHREMLDDVLSHFQVRPDFDLDVMVEGQSLTDVTTRVLERLAPLLRRERPEFVLVQGDTTTAMASSLAAFYEKMPVAHVEAGLRTDDRYSPFPEEIMRRLISQLATLHFAATALAARRLRAEGIAPEGIFLTGNTVVDAVRGILDAAGTPPTKPGEGRHLILVTAHRRENFGAPLERICAALDELVERNADVEIVYPVHPNPQVSDPVRKRLGGRDRIRLLPPLRYDEFVRLMNEAYLVVSDSGGIQEEATVIGKPVLVLRENTERPEALAANATKLVGTDTTRIVVEVERLLRDPEAYAAMSRARSIYGDGRASPRIARILLQLLAGQGSGADEARFAS
jgi:UDP-N-acetylglucosamine 2-epimerase (non-hydrolysing)